MDNISIYHDGHSAPSTPAEMTSGHLLHSIIAFPLISVTERRLKSWLVGSLSSHPFFLARACPMRLTTPVATLWKPPRVSDHIVASDSVIGSGTTKSMISHAISLGAASSAGSSRREDRDAKSILQNRDELSWAKMQTQRGRWHHRQPAARMR